LIGCELPKVGPEFLIELEILHGTSDERIGHRVRTGKLSGESISLVFVCARKDKGMRIKAGPEEFHAPGY
jgi:hypothetical protein